MTAAGRPLRLGIIGAGLMGERMLRAASARSPGLVTVTALWDAEPAALERIGMQQPGAPCVASADAVIDAADCIYIATPPVSHLGYVEQALGAGRAVFVEIPLAVDVAAATAIVRRHEGARAAVNFPFATSAAVGRMSRWIDEGSPGPAFKKLEIEVALNEWPPKTQPEATSWHAAPLQGGFTREVVSHFVYLAQHFLGALVLEAAFVDRPPGRSEHAITARLKADGVAIQLNGVVGAADVVEHTSWTLYSVGTLRLRDGSWAERQRPDGSWVADPDGIAGDQIPFESLASMTNGTPHCLATLEDALQAQAIVEAILSAPDDGRGKYYKRIG